MLAKREPGCGHVVVHPVMHVPVNPHIRFVVLDQVRQVRGERRVQPGSTEPIMDRSVVWCMVRDDYGRTVEGHPQSGLDERPGREMHLTGMPRVEPLPGRMLPPACRSVVVHHMVGDAHADLRGAVEHEVRPQGRAFREDHFSGGIPPRPRPTPNGHLESNRDSAVSLCP